MRKPSEHFFLKSTAAFAKCPNRGKEAQTCTARLSGEREIILCASVDEEEPAKRDHHYLLSPLLHRGRDIFHIKGLDQIEPCNFESEEKGSGKRVCFSLTTT